MLILKSITLYVLALGMPPLHPLCTLVEICQLDVQVYARFFFLFSVYAKQVRSTGVPRSIRRFYPHINTIQLISNSYE